MQGDETVFRGPVAEVFWNTRIKAVHVVWNGYPRLQQFQQVLNTGLELVNTHRGTRWLADSVGLGVLNDEVRNWTNNVWYPNAAQTGLKRIAILIPENAITRMAIDEILVKAPGGIENCYFAAEHEPVAWLTAKP